MPTLKPIPSAMLGDIDQFLAQHRSRCISLYPEAEKIRLRWEVKNIALEDVVSVLVERCGQYDVAVSFDGRDQVEVLWEDKAGRPRRTG